MMDAQTIMAEYNYLKSLKDFKDLTLEERKKMLALIEDVLLNEIPEPPKKPEPKEAFLKSYDKELWNLSLVFLKGKELLNARFSCMDFDDYLYRRYKKFNEIDSYGILQFLSHSDIGLVGWNHSALGYWVEDKINDCEVEL